MHGRFQQNCSAACGSLCCIAEQRQRVSSTVVQLGRCSDCRRACCAMQACCARGCKCRLFSRCLGCGHTSCLATVWCSVVYFIVSFGCMHVSVRVCRPSCCVLSVPLQVCCLFPCATAAAGQAISAAWKHAAGCMHWPGKHVSKRSIFEHNCAWAVGWGDGRSTVCTCSTAENFGCC